MPQDSLVMECEGEAQPVENKKDVDEDYFVSYEDSRVHGIMLEDEARVKSYRDAIFSLQEYIKDKVVMDVGAGTGILSVFCAQAGARKVYAVEASGIAELARKVVEINNFSDIIQVIHAPVEEVQLPSDEKVDAIVSEWMGFYLLHEGMLDSVIVARDKYLKPDGKMLPESAVLYACPCSLPSEFEYWENTYGVNMSVFGEAKRMARKEPLIQEVKQTQLLSKPHAVCQIDLYTVTHTELQAISAKCVSVITTEGRYQGMCLWFDCMFPVLNPQDKPVTLSTSPESPLTHWKQTVIVFQKSQDVEEDQPVAWELNLEKGNDRRYNLTFEFLDPDKVAHPTPCPCHMTKCIVIRTFLECEKEPVDELTLIDDMEEEPSDEVIPHDETCR